MGSQSWVMKAALGFVWAVGLVVLLIAVFMVVNGVSEAIQRHDPRAVIPYIPVILAMVAAILVMVETGWM